MSEAAQETEHMEDAMMQFLDREIDEPRKEKKAKKSDTKASSLSRKDVDAMLDNNALKTMDGCLQILTQLNVRETLMESE